MHSTVHIHTQAIHHALCNIATQMFSTEAIHTKYLKDHLSNNQWQNVKTQGTNCVVNPKKMNSCTCYQTHELACGGLGPNETGSPPALESQELNSRFLFPVHFSLSFSAWKLSKWQQYWLILVSLIRVINPPTSTSTHFATKPVCVRSSIIFSGQYKQEDKQ